MRTSPGARYADIARALEACGHRQGAKHAGNARAREACGHRRGTRGIQASSGREACGHRQGARDIGRLPEREIGKWLACARRQKGWFRIVTSESWHAQETPWSYCSGKRTLWLSCKVGGGSSMCGQVSGDSKIHFGEAKNVAVVQE
ncbi:hypothetical protein VNO80_03167 [Phaseolus coccineus]|uniref:Uncharacterized protein n=1 Tax=Phaseolus coccineus TaxID=3886 RepID=A0AAN9RM84_PHACN